MTKEEAKFSEEQSAQRIRLLSLGIRGQRELSVAVGPRLIRELFLTTLPNMRPKPRSLRRQFARTLGSISSIGLVAMLSSCSSIVPPKPGTTAEAVTRFAGHELQTRKFKKAGISLLMPKGAFDVGTWGNPTWLEKVSDPYANTESRGVHFTLVELSPRSLFLEPSNLCTASFEVYTPEDLRAAGRSLESLDRLPPAPSSDSATAAISFGPITAKPYSGQIAGLDAKYFQIVGRSRDGRVVYGRVTRAEYTSNEKAIARDLNTVTNILTSVRFLDP